MGWAQTEIPSPAPLAQAWVPFLPFAPQGGCCQDCVRASLLWLPAGRLSLWPVGTSPSLIFHLSQGLAPLRLALMWDLLLGEKSRVSEAWSGLCPLPPAQARPRGLPTIRAADPQGDLAGRARALGFDLQADGGAAAWAPKWRRELRSKCLLSYCVSYFYTCLPHETMSIINNNTSIIACQLSTEHEAQHLPCRTLFHP